MEIKISKPNIFEYSNYRRFLGDLYEYYKATKGQFSFRYFSRIAGFNSPNFLKLVIEGKRNLSSESIEKFAQALKLNKEEAVFFRNLVLMDQASTAIEKRYCAEELLKSRLYRKLHPLKPAQYAYYSHWYYVPIRELVGTKNFREDPEWIARTLNPSVTAAEARSALEALQQLGLIKRDENGKLLQTDGVLSTGDEVSSISITQFHREMIQKGSEAIDRFSPADRDISSLTLGLSKDGVRQIKELVQRFRKELLAIAQGESGPEEVVQLNFQLFPLTKKNEEAVL